MFNWHFTQPTEGHPMKRSAITTNTPQALERGIDVISAAYEAGESVGKISAEALIHELWADLGHAEKAAQLPVPQRQWRCEQDRWMGLFGAIGASVIEDASDDERAYLARQRGAEIAPADESVAEAIDWTDETESPTERRARNWAARTAR
jgi:hypothetical protein